MSELAPRRLRLLRIEDDNVTSTIQHPAFPIEVATLSRWSHLLQRLSDPDTLKCDLLGIDIQFNKDISGPPMPKISGEEFQNGRYDPNQRSQETLDDPLLGNLVWAPALRAFGKNNGIVMGSILAGLSLDADLPVGVGVHTAHPLLPLYDATTAMLLTEILAAGSALEDTDSDLGLLRSAVLSLQGGPNRKTLEDVFPEMLDRFRKGFRHRAGKAQRILVDQESLDQLVALFHSVESEEELDAGLSRLGIRFYDREGHEDCLDLRSVFADKILERALNEDSFRLPSLAVKPPSHDRDTAGEVYQFVHDLYSGELSYLTSIIEFFERYKNRDPNRHEFSEFKKPLHRTIALLFAWCYVQAESSHENTSWDPIANQPADGQPGFTTRLVQVQTLHHILANAHKEGDAALPGWDATTKHVPLSLDGQPSIMRAVRHYCLQGGDRADNLLMALRYDDDQNLSGRRHTAVAHLLEDLVRSKHLDQVNLDGVKWFRVINTRPPQYVHPPTNAEKMLEVLGLSPKDPHVPIQRILQRSPIAKFSNATPAEFFRHLEEDRLPSRFAKHCQHFMKTVWKEIPESKWPPCIKDMPQPPAAVKSPEAPGQDRTSPTPAERAAQILHDLWTNFMSPEGSSPCAAVYYRTQQAMDDVGGDLVRIYANAEGPTSVAFLDAPGKGQPAVTIAINLAMLMRNHPEAHHDPEKMFAVLNDSDFGRHGIYVPCVHVTISPDRKTMKYANAGQDFPLLVRADGQIKDLESTTSLLGVLAQAEANQKTLELHPGDRIVIYSDGLSDAMNGDGAWFSRLRIVQASVKYRHLGAREMVEAILDDAHAFCRDCPWKDDVTLIVIAL